MALRDAMEQSKTSCKTTLIIERLNAEDIETLEEWISRGYSIMSISKAISTDNPENKVNDQTLRKHFTGSCSCSATSKLFGVLS